MNNQPDLEASITALQKLSKIQNYLLAFILVVGVVQLFLLFEIVRVASSIFVGMPTR